ncbi:eEF1A lysine and N-terminal methyltransferase homolog [Bactrocera dorsalis]|uniref:EEF1A lysine and N-terminal methyltransferase homolog n=1 Tax=Bactrocera dorsalis TaxID=27457 RepID=A0A6I9VIX1_BACDO|nr:eEF1A lysine and N-terminal methyltransferase homolog [Bactrocera dorsalis]
MNLLPKSHEEFAQPEYWNSFFTKRGEKAFEWYGEYLELCEQIHKYVKNTDQILMLGCGNSQLSMDMYDSGFRNITNIDISTVAIRKMLEVNAHKRESMKFLQMDATQMTFEDEYFSVALDKGTLDALFVDDTPEVHATVERYFNEIKRTMRNGGRYLCITLLQEHILKYILDYFPRNGFMLRVVHCADADRANQEKNADNPDVMPMPVFIVIATKFKALPIPILEFSLGKDKMQRLPNVQELKNAVTAVQRAALICNGLARTNIAGHEEVVMDLCQPGESTRRYTVHVLDQPPARGLGKFAAFIVPQGREIEWLFATTQGRRKLHSSAKFQRLAVVTLHRDQEYVSLDTVKCELAESIKSLAPIGLTEQIPFLSLGADVGKRETLVSGFSQISGDFRIEEVEGNDGKIFRRLIFLSNQFVVQSEALVKTIKLKGKKERKKIDFGYLACQHHLYMSAGVQLAIGSKNAANEVKDVVVVGLGGGGLCSFLHAAVPSVRLTAVEIDPIMLEVAEQYFELKQDNRFHVVIDDGLSFLETCKNEEIKFNAVLFDVDSKDLSLGMSCPPKSFLEPTVLNNIKSIIGDKGLFILNLVCRDEALRDEALLQLRSAFKSVCCYKLDEDINEIIYCSNNEKYKSIAEWKKDLGAAARRLNNAAKEQNLHKEEMLEVTEFLNELKI